MGFIFRESYIAANWDDVDDLNSHLISCGHEIVDAGYANWGLKRGCRRLVIWQYSLRGTGRVRVDGCERSVPPGHCLLVQVPEDHWYGLPQGEPSWEFIYVTLGGEESTRLGAMLRARRGSVFPVPDRSSVISAAWNIIEAGRLNTLVNRYRTSALAYDFMMKLFQSDADAGGAPPPGGYLLLRIRNYCANRIAEPLTVDDLARCAGYSRWHFSRLFKKITGKSPHRFVLEQKINYALRLLQATGEPLKVVAERCGFDDASYFCKVFRNICGTTPDGFRRGDAVKRL